MKELDTEKLTRVITVFKTCSRCLKLQLTLHRTVLMPARSKGSSSRILHSDYNIWEKNMTQKFIRVVASLHDNIPVTIWSSWKEIPVLHDTEISLAVISSTHCFVNMKSSFCVCMLLYISFICHSISVSPTNKHVCNSWSQDPGGTEQYSIGRWWSSR